MFFFVSFFTAIHFFFGLNCSFIAVVFVFLIFAVNNHQMFSRCFWLCVFIENAIYVTTFMMYFTSKKANSCKSNSDGKDCLYALALILYHEIIYVYLGLCYHIKKKWEIKIKTLHVNAIQLYSQDYPNQRIFNYERFINVSIYAFNKKTLWKKSITAFRYLKYLDVHPRSMNIYVYENNNVKTHRIYLNDDHSRNCNCYNKFQYPFTLEIPCSWIKIDLVFNLGKLNDFNMDNVESLKELALLSKLNYHCLTKFNNRYIKKRCLLDIILNVSDFDVKVTELIKFLLESIIIREDGLKLMNEFLQFASSAHKTYLVKVISKNIFKIWPPPLWFFSLMKLRQTIRTTVEYDVSCENDHSNIMQFVLNPIENVTPFDTFSLLSLDHTKVWKDVLVTYGIFQSLVY